MYNTKRKNLILAIAILINIFIFYQSTIPGSESGALSGTITYFVRDVLSYVNINVDISNLSLLIRKLAHFTEFFFLAIFWFLFYKHDNFFKKAIIITLVHGVLVAFADEYIQTFIDGRAGSLIDVGIDSLGVITALMIIVIVNFYKNLDKGDNK